MPRLTEVAPPQPTRPHIPQDFPHASQTTITANQRRRAIGAQTSWPDHCETVARRRYLARFSGYSRALVTCDCANCRERFAAFADAILGPLHGQPTHTMPRREPHTNCTLCGRRRNTADCAHNPLTLTYTCNTCDPNPSQFTRNTCAACGYVWYTPQGATPPICSNCHHVLGDPVPPQVREHSYRPANIATSVFSMPGEPTRLPQTLTHPITIPVPVPPLPPDPADTPPTRNQRVPVPTDHLSAGYFTPEQFRAMARNLQLEYWRDWRDRVANRRRAAHQPTTIQVQPTSALFIGSELEIELPHTANATAVLTAIDPHSQGLLYYKRDGSLSNGFEIVTLPFTEAWYRDKGIDIFNAVCNQLRDLNCRSHTPGTCGFHIHLSKAAFTNFHLYKFTRFWLSDARAVEIISQRQRNTLDRWAKLTSPETPARIARNKRTSIDRYSAVNVTANTVELRAFRGNTIASRIHKNIECALASFHFTKGAAIPDLNWPAFSTWAKARPKQYPNLVPFITQHLDTNTIASEPVNA
jgi:hypothetical protein